MEIRYIKEKVKRQLEDNKYLIKNYGNDIAKKFIVFKTTVVTSKDFAYLKRIRPGLKIELLKGFTNKYSARLNIQYRVEFFWTENEALVIDIIRIHPHKY